MQTEPFAKSALGKPATAGKPGRNALRYRSGVAAAPSKKLAGELNFLGFENVIFWRFELSAILCFL
jgi:hypothetical protein